MHEFNAGAVVGRSLTIWGRNVLPFSILMLIVHSPVILYLALAEVDSSHLSYVLFGQQALDLLAVGTMVYGVFQQLRGQPVSWLSCVGVGLGRFFPVLGVGILLVLSVAGAVVPFWMVGGLIGPAGLLLLGLPSIVFCIIVWCMLWVAIPVAVVERPGVMASLRRSRELTRGHKGSIFGIVFLLHLITAAIAFFLQKILEATLEDTWTTVIISQGIQAILGGIHAVSTAVGYHDLRQAKEGVGIEELVKVFE